MPFASIVITAYFLIYYVVRHEGESSLSRTSGGGLLSTEWCSEALPSGTLGGCSFQPNKGHCRCKYVNFQCSGLRSKPEYKKSTTALVSVAQLVGATSCIPKGGLNSCLEHIPRFRVWSPAGTYGRQPVDILSLSLKVNEHVLRWGLKKPLLPDLSVNTKYWFNTRKWRGNILMLYMKRKSK